jgi:hypothetical protein
MKILQRAALLTAFAAPCLLAAPSASRAQGDFTHDSLRALLETRLVIREPEQSDPKPNQPRPELDDFLVSALDGKVTAAVVALDRVLGMNGKRVILPVARLRLGEDAGKAAFLVDLTREELEALPPFDGGKHGGRAQNGPRIELATALAKAPVRGSDGEFGKVSDVAVDVAALRLDYLLVAAADAEGARKTYVVPYLACKPSGDGEALALDVAKTVEQLSGAPPYVKPNQGFISRRTMELADEYFEIRRPK